MTTLEKMFVQIFERKNRIIEEVQRQADAYTEDLASRLLIDGITPPPSLLNQRFNSRSSDPHGTLPFLSTYSIDTSILRVLWKNFYFRGFLEEFLAVGAQLGIM